MPAVIESRTRIAELTAFPTRLLIYLIRLALVAIEAFLDVLRHNSEIKSRIFAKERLIHIDVVYRLALRRFAGLGPNGDDICTHSQQVMDLRLINAAVLEHDGQIHSPSIDQHKRGPAEPTCHPSAGESVRE